MGVYNERELCIRLGMTMGHRPGTGLRQKIVRWLNGMSFTTGMIVLAVCVLCYVVSFAQMTLPISTESKAVLWVVFFGLAKATQYTAILILGKEGVRRVRNRLKRKRDK